MDSDCIFLPPRRKTISVGKSLLRCMDNGSAAPAFSSPGSLGFPSSMGNLGGELGNFHFSIVFYMPGTSPFHLSISIFKF